MTKHACHVIYKEELEPKRKNYCQNYVNQNSERERQTGAKLFKQSESSRAESDFKKLRCYFGGTLLILFVGCIPAT